MMDVTVCAYLTGLLLISLGFFLSVRHFKHACCISHNLFRMQVHYFCVLDFSGCGTVPF